MVLVSICHGADASTIYIQSCRKLETDSKAVVTSTTSKETSAPTSTISVEAATEATTTETIAENVVVPTGPTPINSAQLLFSESVNERPNLNRTCPTDIGPSAVCYDQRPAFGCYCLVVTHVSLLHRCILEPTSRNWLWNMSTAQLVGRGEVLPGKFDATPVPWNGSGTANDYGTHRQRPW